MHERRAARVALDDRPRNHVAAVSGLDEVDEVLIREAAEHRHLIRVRVVEQIIERAAIVVHVGAEHV